MGPIFRAQGILVDNFQKIRKHQYSKVPMRRDADKPSLYTLWDRTVVLH